MRKRTPINLTEEAREQLEAMSRSRTLEGRLVQRAKIVLLAAEGLSNRIIGARLGIDYRTVMCWQNRFREQGFEGIEKEVPGRGRKPRIQAETVLDVVEKTLQEKPEDATHWSLRRMAQVSGLSKSTVHRIWQSRGLKPHLCETFKLSTDPQFESKLVDVVGLYLDPPEHAIVFSVDEKSQIQALDRTQPGLPMKPWRCGTMTHDYKRNGTTTLFAAMDTLTGKVIAQCMPRHRHQEWLRFLKRIRLEAAEGLDLHIICDNYSTHKHPSVQRWLAKYPHIKVHFVPTSSSWLNMVERFFRDITENHIRRGAFKSVDALKQTILEAIEQHNEAPRPYIWTAKATDILAKVIRARTALNGSSISETPH